MWREEGSRIIDFRTALRFAAVRDGTEGASCRILRRLLLGRCDFLRRNRRRAVVVGGNLHHDGRDVVEPSAAVRLGDQRVNLSIGSARDISSIWSRRSSTMPVSPSLATRNKSPTRTSPS